MKSLLQLSITIFTVFTLFSTVYAADKITVKTAKISEVAIYPERSAPATVVSLNESIISARITARVDEISVRVGDIVEKGGVLARLDCEDYVLSHRESVARREALETKRDLASRRVERTRQLILKQSIAEEILDERESDYAVLGAELRGIQAEIKRKKLDQSHCTVLSPFRALVIERASAVGEFVNVGTALVKVMDIDEIVISAQILSRDSAQVSQASELYFEHNNIRYPVKLRSIVQAINTETRNREVRLMFNDAHALPGAAGRLIWRDGRAHIPGDLLVRRNGKLGVFTVDGNVARFNSMPTAQAGRASVTSLGNDINVVIEGHFSLKEAVPVNIVN
ncbi:MAG: efflux RND transporter periplasmic adaptor subunit [Gammaproteobacteria bacterium]|nr:MAG: efflux RND transporter periplasmic adaptor subunit [Gammaproteobacteria bacterium]